MQDTEAEFNHYENLKAELDKIVDANGNIKKGYEDRAKFITTELAEATGIEIDNNGKIIKNYKDISEQIDKTIQKKKTEAYLEAYRESYTVAIKNQTKAQQDLLKAEQHRNEAKQRYVNLEKQIKEEEQELAKLKQIINPSNEDVKRMNELNNSISDGKEKLAIYRDELSEANTDWQKAKSVYTDYATTIQNYETLNTALITGDEKKIKAAQENLVNDFITATNGTKHQLDQQYTNWQEHYDRLLEESKKEGSTITQETINQAKNMVDKSKAELDKYNKNYKGSTDNIKKELFQQLVNAEQHYKELKALVGREGYGVTQGMVNRAGQTVDDIKKKFNTLVPYSKTVGENFVLGFSDGVLGKDEKASKVDKSLNTLTSRIKGITQIGLGISSPSKVAKQYGVWFVQGFANGINDSLSMVSDATAGISDVALAAFSETQDNLSKNNQMFNTAYPVTSGNISTTNQTNNFNIYSPKPIDAIEAAEEIKKVQKQFAEGFI